MSRVIAEIWPSYYWPQNAEVIVLDCGHKHVRPKDFAKIGDVFECCFCDDKPAA